MRTLLLAVAFAVAIASICVTQPENLRSLTFAQRVGYQRAIEEVYWRHRIWPKENPNPKPSLDAVMSQAQVEKKVVDYLRNSQPLEDHWQRPIASEQLQDEMNRMAQNTNQPEVLREIFGALGNDPFLIAECLARSVLSERLLANFGHAKEPLDSAPPRAEKQLPKLMTRASANYTLPTISDRPSGCVDNWAATSTINAPTGRYEHTAVWTGSEMIVWGGEFPAVNTGGRYNPSTDSWTATSTTNAPSARYDHTAVWTGTEMIVWGAGVGNTGGRYNPITDSWTATSTVNAPSGRAWNTAVWTGSEMIVWGGFDGSELNTGGRYDPITDSWTATNTTNAPTARFYHTAVWTGSAMIVWGGRANNSPLATGGRYYPGTDSWIPTGGPNGPSLRYLHTAVWTGSEMIVWGGQDNQFILNTGGGYDPGTDSWIATNTTDAPSAREFHTAVWTGSEMIVWGGFSGPVFNTGGKYNPGTNSWTPTSTTNAASARDLLTAVWTGSEMIVWGGEDRMNVLNTGGRYCAQPSATPTPTSTVTPTPTVTTQFCSVTSPLCGFTVFNPPTTFDINVLCGVNPATVQASDLTVNGIPADTFTLINGNTTIRFQYINSPAVPGQNTMHIAAGAFNCCNGPVPEFTCTFTYQPSTPTPTPTATPTLTPRVAPTPRVHPTPAPRL